MIVFLFLTLTLLLALVALGTIRRAFWGSQFMDWPLFALALSLSGFVFLYGAWIYFTAYGCYAFAMAVIALCIYGVTARQAQRSPTRQSRHAQRASTTRSGHPRHTGTIRHLAIAAVFMTLNILYFTGTGSPPSFAELRFPLKTGQYFVLQGGKGLPANLFHFNSRRAAYAMDIVKLDRWGRRSTSVFSRTLEDYYIFGDTVFSPCDGIVERAVSDNPDNIPPIRKRGPNNLNGVVVSGSAYTVYLGHLQQNGVFVQAGDHVAAGQPLGLVGNSGMSLEPHLHIQVHSKNPGTAPWYRRPQCFIRFNGRSYLLFERIDAR